MHHLTRLHVLTRLTRAEVASGIGMVENEVHLMLKTWSTQVPHVNQLQAFIVTTCFIGQGSAAMNASMTSALGCFHFLDSITSLHCSLI